MVPGSLPWGGGGVSAYLFLERENVKYYKEKVENRKAGQSFNIVKSTA